ncbi:hypothetical protein V2O64_10480 [Verrucomicrobiaceae bacterium 227]
MKYRYLSLPALFLVAGHASGQNLILNGDFETGLVGSHNYAVDYEGGSLSYGPPSYGADLPTNWTRGEGELRGWTVSDLDLLGGELDGNYAFRLDANNAGNPNGGPETLRQGALELLAGQEYVFRVDFFGSESLGALLVVGLAGSGDAEGELIELGTIEDTTDGEVQKVEVVFTPETGGTYELQISAGNSDNNHPIIDNVVLEPNVGDVEPIFTNISASGESVTLVWNSEIGAVYALDYSLDLVNWNEITDNVNSQGAVTTYEEIIANRSPDIQDAKVLFYRFRQLPDA